MTKSHENVLRESPLSLPPIVKFFSSNADFFSSLELETKIIPQGPNEIFLRITLCMIDVSCKEEVPSILLPSLVILRPILYVSGSVRQLEPVRRL